MTSSLEPLFPQQPVTARYTPLEALRSNIVPEPTSKRSTARPGSVYVALYKNLLKAITVWRLKREAVSLMNSFFAISEAMGLSPYSSKISPEQQQRLKRTHEIAAELRQLNYRDMEAKS